MVTAELFVILCFIAVFKLYVCMYVCAASFGIIKNSIGQLSLLPSVGW